MKYDSIVVGKLLFLLFTNAALAVELAPFFNGYTDSCDVSDKSGKKLLEWLGTLDEKGTIGSKPTLPADLAAALGDPIVIDYPYHWMITVPVKTGTFNGIKISQIKRWVGKTWGTGNAMTGNGIGGFAIVFDASPTVIKRAFKRVRFETSEMGVAPILQFDKATGKSSLDCDSSN